MSRFGTRISKYYQHASVPVFHPPSGCSTPLPNRLAPLSTVCSSDTSGTARLVIVDRTLDVSDEHLGLPIIGNVKELASNALYEDAVGYSKHLGKLLRYVPKSATHLDLFWLR